MNPGKPIGDTGKPTPGVRTPNGATPKKDAIFVTYEPRENKRNDAWKPTPTLDTKKNQGKLRDATRP
jgi:hypothetical protein